MLVKNYSEYDFLKDYGFLAEDEQKRILNVGSSTLRYGANCVNVDIQQKPNVDVVCDIHDLPESLGLFDAIICNAVLQYCVDPNMVARQFLKVLKPGGYLFVDAPWMQPFCPDTPDKFRFSEDGLRAVFTEFEIVDVGVGIRPGAAFAFLGVQMAYHLTSFKYLNYALAQIAKVMLFPFCRIRTKRESWAAGSFYMICRKPMEQVVQAFSSEGAPKTL